MFFIPAGRKLSKPEYLANYALPTVLVFLALMIVTTLSWRSSKQAINNEIQLAVARKLTDTQTTVNQRLQSYAEILRGGAGLFSASDTVTREEWKRFIAVFDIPNRYPGIQGIGYSQVVPADQLEAHIAQIKASGIADYHIWPEGDREVYTSILYLEPAQGRNLNATGYDMFAEAVRRKAMEQARDNAEVTLTTRTQLVQDVNDASKAGFLMYQPIYKGGSIPAATEQRRQQLLGYIYAPFRGEDLFGKIYNASEAYGAFRVFSDTKPNDSQLIYQTPNYQALSSQHPMEATAQVRTGLSVWTVQYAASKAIVDGSVRSRATIVLLRGALISAFVTLFVLTLLISRQSG